MFIDRKVESGCPPVRRAMSVVGDGRALFVTEELEHVLWIIGDVEPLQQSQVLAPEALLGMMLLLAADVPNHGVQVRVRVGECAKAFLPVEPPSDPSLALDEFGRVGLNVSDQIRERNAGPQADQYVSVIRHAVYLNKLLPLFS